MEGRGLGEKGGGEGIDQLRTILRTGIPEYSCLCVNWEILSDASNETVFKCSVQVDEPDRKWCHSMGLYSPDSKIKFNFLFYFSHSFRHFRDPASSFWFEERRKYLPADDDRFWLVWSGILSAARTKGTVSQDGLGF